MYYTDPTGALPHSNQIFNKYLIYIYLLQNNATTRVINIIEFIMAKMGQSGQISLGPAVTA